MTPKTSFFGPISLFFAPKRTVWERLHEDKFWEKQKCIIMSSQGQTTRGIRRLLQRLSEEHKLPIYVLTDFDPWGFYIYSVIKYGSIALAHLGSKMTIIKLTSPPMYQRSFLHLLLLFTRARRLKPCAQPHLLSTR